MRNFTYKQFLPAVSESKFSAVKLKTSALTVAVVQSAIAMGRMEIFMVKQAKGDQQWTVAALAAVELGHVTLFSGCADKTGLR